MDLVDTPAKIFFVYNYTICISHDYHSYINSEIKKNDKYGFHKRFFVFILLVVIYWILLSIHRNTQKILVF